MTIKAVPAIGWSSKPSGSARMGFEHTDSKERRQWEAGPAITTQVALTKLRPRKDGQRHEGTNKHVCFTAAYRIQSGRLVLELVGKTLRSSGV